MPTLLLHLLDERRILDLRVTERRPGTLYYLILVEEVIRRPQAPRACGSLGRPIGGRASAHPQGEDSNERHGFEKHEFRRGKPGPALPAC